MISQATPTVMIGDRKIMLIAVLAARIFGLGSRKRDRGIVDRFLEMGYSLSICRLANAAQAGPLNNCAMADSMAWALALFTFRQAVVRLLIPSRRLLPLHWAGSAPG